MQHKSWEERGAHVMYYDYDGRKRLKRRYTWALWAFGCGTFCGFALSLYL